MSNPETELTDRLQTAANAAIAKALAERKLPAQATLADIERAARSAGAEIEQAIASALAQESAAALPAWPNCPQCGQKMKNKGKRHRRVVTEAGEIEVERTYYHCAACGQGVFPPGSAVGIDGGRL
jgi:NADH pyrophosphatase NudC (nudix superfamily)